MKMINLFLWFKLPTVHEPISIHYVRKGECSVAWIPPLGSLRPRRASSRNLAFAFSWAAKLFVGTRNISTQQQLALSDTLYFPTSGDIREVPLHFSHQPCRCLTWRPLGNSLYIRMIRGEANCQLCEQECELLRPPPHCQLRRHQAPRSET